MEKKKLSEEKDRIFIIWLERYEVRERRNGGIVFPLAPQFSWRKRREKSELNFEIY